MFACLVTKREAVCTVSCFVAYIRLSKHAKCCVANGMLSCVRFTGLTSVKMSICSMFIYNAAWTSTNVSVEHPTSSLVLQVETDFKSTSSRGVTNQKISIGKQ